MPESTLRINSTQRGPIYAQLIQNLSGIGDVNLLYERQQFADAATLGRRFAKDLRLLGDLSWFPSEDRDSFDLTAPPDDLWLVLHRLRDEAQGGLSLNPPRSPVPTPH